MKLWRFDIIYNTDLYRSDRSYSFLRSLARRRSRSTRRNGGLWDKWFRWLRLRCSCRRRGKRTLRGARSSRSSWDTSGWTWEVLQQKYKPWVLSCWLASARSWVIVTDAVQSCRRSPRWRVDRICLSSCWEGRRPGRQDTVSLSPLLHRIRKICRIA